MTNAAFSEKPDKYSYFKLADGSADIFIRIFDHEETNYDGEVSYICKVNEFRTKQSVITEEMIVADPEKYLDYTPPGAITEMERLEAVESALLELMGVGHD